MGAPRTIEEEVVYMFLPEAEEAITKAGKAFMIVKSDGEYKTLATEPPAGTVLLETTNGKVVRATIAPTVQTATTT